MPTQSRRPRRAAIARSLHELQTLWRPPPENDTAEPEGNPVSAAEESTDTANDTAGRGIRQQAKRAIIALAIWGLLPAGFASWLLRRGGMRHV